MLSTPDICDKYESDVRVLDALFTDFGGKTEFCGEVVTIKCFEDNSVVKKLLDTPGRGRVIVMDGGGSLRRAILGDMLAQKGVDNGWAGLLINGCVRDVEILATLDIGVKALKPHPMKTEKRDLGDLNVSVSFAGQTINPGDWLYADKNGVVIANKKLD